MALAVITPWVFDLKPSRMKLLTIFFKKSKKSVICYWITDIVTDLFQKLQKIGNLQEASTLLYRWKKFFLLKNEQMCAILITEVLP